MNSSVSLKPRPLKMAVAVLSAVFTAALLAVCSAMVVLVTPLWAAEILCSHRTSTRFVSLQNCENYLEWMFSRSIDIDSSLGKRGVRLWGFEFVYR